MKRFLVAAGLAVAALSLPATAAMADGYERKHVAKPKPKAKAHKKHHAKPKQHHYEEKVVDHAKHYGAGHKVVHISKHEEYSRTYYEERDGHVVAHYGTKVNAREGCYPNAPCTWGFGARHPVAVSPGWGSWGHPGGVGYGVDGGYHGWAMYSPYAAGWTSYSRSVSEARTSSKVHGRSGHHGMAGHHGVDVQHGGMMHGGGMHHGMGGQHDVVIQRGPMHPPAHPQMHHPRPRGW
ncbi:MAG TPA: hypothetical protein VF699_11500 [Caulobacteraceae bacterium]|jgi:Ni/Co efflux regulator RcnB